MASYNPRKYLLTSTTLGTSDGNNEACYMCFVCPDYCTKFHLSPSPQLSPPQKYQMSPTLIIVLCILGATFLLFSYVIAARCRYSTSTNSTGLMGNGAINLIDENQGSLVLSHPSDWFIHTVGLPRSIIDSIGVVRYKRGEVLRDCCICLSEFQEEERLRVLTTCSHAFHVACIDTWLMSHMDCPVCRAPAVVIFKDDIISSNSAGSDQQEERNQNMERRDIIHEDHHIGHVLEDDEKSEFVQVGVPSHDDQMEYFSGR